MNNSAQRVKDKLRNISKEKMKIEEKVMKQLEEINYE